MPRCRELGLLPHNTKCYVAGGLKYSRYSRGYTYSPHSKVLPRNQHTWGAKAAAGRPSSLGPERFTRRSFAAAAALIDARPFSSARELFRPCYICGERREFWPIGRGQYMSTAGFGAFRGERTVRACGDDVRVAA